MSGSAVRKAPKSKAWRVRVFMSQKDERAMPPPKKKLKKQAQLEEHIKQCKKKKAADAFEIKLGSAPETHQVHVEGEKEQRKPRGRGTEERKAEEEEEKRRCKGKRKN